MLLEHSIDDQQALPEVLNNHFSSPDKVRVLRKDENDAFCDAHEGQAKLYATFCVLWIECGIV